MTALGALRFAQEVLRNIDALQCREKAVPGGGLARQDHVPGLRVLADEDFLGVEPKGRRQPYGLAAAVGEELGGLGHAKLRCHRSKSIPFLDIYQDISFADRSLCWAIGAIEPLRGIVSGPT